MTLQNSLIYFLYLLHQIAIYPAKLLQNNLMGLCYFFPHIGKYEFLINNKSGIIFTTREKTDL